MNMITRDLVVILNFDDKPILEIAKQWPRKNWGIWGLWTLQNKSISGLLLCERSSPLLFQSTVIFKFTLGIRHFRDRSPYSHLISSLSLPTVLVVSHPKACISRFLWVRAFSSPTETCSADQSTTQYNGIVSTLSGYSPLMRNSPCPSRRQFWDCSFLLVYRTSPADLNPKCAKR